MVAKKRYFKTSLILFGLGLLLPNVAVMAEESNVFQLSPILVTTQKAQEDKQDVPASVSVLGEDILKDYDITTAEELAMITPSVDFLRADNFTTYLVYRGIGGTTTMNKIYNLNVDGVTLPYVAPNISLDVERIEVIRGSLGSLYGRNTLGGLVTLTTKEPNETANGYFNANYESYNTYQVQAAVGGPVTDTIAGRLAVSYKDSDGYFDNTFLSKDNGNENEQFSLNGKLQLMDSPAGKVTLSLITDRFDGGFDNYAIGGGYETRNNETGYNDGYLIAPILTFEKDYSSFTITSISNYSHSNYGFLHDWDFTEYDLQTGEFDEVTGSFSQEFRFNGENGNSFKWLTGAYLLHEKNDSETEVVMGSDAYFGPGMDYRGVTMSQDSTITTNNVALFGQAIYTFDSNIEITGRMRLDYEEKNLDWVGRDNMGSPDTEQAFDADWFAALPSASLAWVPNELHRTYLSISQGYKSGDYNNVQVEATVVTEAVDPEYSLTYEAGYKGLLLDKKLEFNLAAFYIDWTDIQVDTPISVDGQLSYVKQNAAEAHSSGVEIEARAQLAKGWNVFLGANYLFEYEFDSFADSPAGDLAGRYLPQTSEYSVSTGSTYRHSSGFFLSVDASLFGPKFFDEANQFKQEDYTLVNAKVGYETEGWSVYLYGRNLLDEEYSVSMFSNAELAGEPLFAGVKAELRF